MQHVPLAGNFDVMFSLNSFLQVYYVPAENPDPYPPVFDVYLNKLAPTIGGEVKWSIL